MTAVEQNYVKLKTYFITEINKKKDLSIKDIKLMFVDTINSPRRLRQIQSLSDLISVLEKRDFLDIGKVQPLKDIAQCVSGNTIDVLRLINEHEALSLAFNDVISQRLNQYAAAEVVAEPIFHVISKVEPEVLIPTKSSHEPTPQIINKTNFAIPFYQGDKRKLIFDLITRKIGKNWYDLARNLDIAQSEIDEIEMKYERDLKRRVFAILNLFEERCDRSKIQYLLCNALNKSRRGDLRRDVEEILSRTC